MTFQKGHLAWIINGRTTPLEHWHFDTFSSLKGEEPFFENLRLQFRLGLDGEVEAVESAMEAAVKPIVFTKKVDARLSDPLFLHRLAGIYTLTSSVEMKVTLRGNVLVGELTGRGTYDLVPVRGMRFVPKGLSGFAIQFSLPASGSATQIEFEQSDAVYTCKRKS